MSLTSYVDAYCERVDPGFWSEPLNALTNLGFALGAWLLWRMLRRLRSQGLFVAPEIRALPALMLVIAACSFLFHTLALVWAGLADQLAILLFGCAFLYAFLRRIVSLATGIALVGAVLFSAASYLSPGLLPTGFLNQSGAYLPYLAALLGMTLYLKWQRRAAYREFLRGVLLFCIALALRTADQAACELIPAGTHFAWHLVNAFVLFQLSSALARAGASTR
jgi:hypothetical protein